MISHMRVDETTKVEVAIPKAERDPLAEGKDIVSSDLSSTIEDSDDPVLVAPSEANDANKARKVTFSTLEIREYPILPGDNPSVMMGCPLTIDWEYDFNMTCSVEDYEESRPTPRTMTELRIPSTLRQEKLLRVGFSRRHIQEATKEAAVVRLQRRRTEETMNLAPVQYFFERAKRKTLGLVKGGSKRNVRELLQRTSSTGGSVVAGKSALRRDYSLRDSLETLPLDQSLSSN